MTDNVTLDRVAVGEQYDFSNMYNEYISHLDDENDETLVIDMEKSKYYSPNEFKQLICESNHKSLSAFCVNCQSITAHWDGITDLISNMNHESHGLDIIGLTEIF